MGGFGSGRKGRNQPLVEDCFVISVGKLNKIGGIGDKQSYILEWRNPENQEVLSEISVEASGNRLVLKYQVISRDHEEKINVLAFVDIEWTHPYFGGKRPWFVCPNCGKRISKLYKPKTDQLFRCRSCHALSYQSRKEGNDRLAITLNKINRLKKKLGVCGATEYTSLPPRPKGQHKKTYKRLLEQLLAAEEEAQKAIDTIYNRFTTGDDAHEQAI